MTTSLTLVWRLFAPAVQGKGPSEALFSFRACKNRLDFNANFFFFGSHDACLICFFLYASHQSFINVNVNMINGLKCGQSYKCVCMCVYVWVGVTGAWLGTQPHLHAAHMLRDTLHRWKIRRHNHTHKHTQIFERKRIKASCLVQMCITLREERYL